MKEGGREAADADGRMAVGGIGGEDEDRSVEVGRLVESGMAELIAERVVSMLREASSESPPLIDANEVARILGCERGFVYEHQAELGAVRLGGGRRPRLRFDRARVEAIASAPRTSAEVSLETRPQHRSPRRRRPRRSAVKLLEIKGRAP